MSLLAIGTAEAAFPGQNGKIAFMARADDGSIPCAWTVDPDGTSRAALQDCTNSGDRMISFPAWSPDGSKIAFWDVEFQSIETMNADGSGRDFTSGWGDEVWGLGWSPDGDRIAYSAIFHDSREIDWGIWTYRPTDDPSDTRHVREINATDLEWSPDGTRIALSASQGVWLVKPDGTNLVEITPPGFTNAGGPSWSPDGARIAFGGQTADGNNDVYTMDSDGSNVQRLTTDAASDQSPAWSPDGTMIAFRSNRGPAGIYVMSADGTDQRLVTENGFGPDWQPIPVNAYPRPKGASPTDVPLVPAYEPCTSPTRTHGPPLAFGSCAPPTQKSGQLTVGTPDANGQPAKLRANIRINPLRGLPSTSADEADVRVRATINDVRLRSDLSDYTGDLEVRLALQITDRDNTPHPGGPGPGTVQELTHSHPLPCSTTPADNAVGSLCQFDTTIEAVVPGAVKELTRGVWELQRITVHDAPGNLFLTQGIFVP